MFVYYLIVYDQNNNKNVYKFDIVHVHIIQNKIYVRLSSTPATVDGLYGLFSRGSLRI